MSSDECFLGSCTLECFGFVVGTHIDVRLFSVQTLNELQFGRELKASRQPKYS